MIFDELKNRVEYITGLRVFEFKRRYKLGTSGIMV